MFGKKEGEALVRLARKSIEFYLHTGRRLAELPEEKGFREKKGVFVTLYTWPEKELRGCIGCPEPVKPLWDGVIENAVYSAFKDPRFHPLTADELEKIVVSVSVLTKPEEIKVERPEQYHEKIEIGRHGLIVENGSSKGLLLPQVAPEQKWDSKQFLKQACIKACLDTNSWKEEGTNVYSFEALVFSEKRPRGEVVGKRG